MSIDTLSGIQFGAQLHGTNGQEATVHLGHVEMLLPDLEIFSSVVYGLRDGGGLQSASRWRRARVLHTGEMHGWLGFPHVVEAVRVVHGNSFQAAAHHHLTDRGGEWTQRSAIGHRLTGHKHGGRKLW